MDVRELEQRRLNVSFQAFFFFTKKNFRLLILLFSICLQNNRRMSFESLKKIVRRHFGRSFVRLYQAARGGNCLPAELFALPNEHCLIEWKWVNSISTRCSVCSCITTDSHLPLRHSAPSIG